MALLDIAMAFGCHPQELSQRFTGRELHLFVVRQMMKNGYTYIQEDIEKIEQQKRADRHAAFLQQAQSHWNNGK